MIPSRYGVFELTELLIRTREQRRTRKKKNKGRGRRRRILKGRKKRKNE